ncbi:MAG: DUF2975 domain-containing protein [Ginsengibacter sp.]
MDIRITTKQISVILYVISWIIFIGICIEACAFIFSTFSVFIFDPATAQKFWRPVDLSNVFEYDKGFFTVMNIYIIIVTVLKAILFYQIIKILGKKKLDASRPFNREVILFISLISYITFGIGLFCAWGVNYSEWIIKKGMKVPNIQELGIGGADVWLFMGIVLFVIVHIFKRGMEIQSENDLTI